MTIGERIKERRKQLGLSVDDVAERLNKNRATVYRYESNEIEKLPTTVLEPLAKVLNTTPEYLMGWTEQVEQKEQSDVKRIKCKNMTLIRNIESIKLKKYPLLGSIACGQPIFADEDKETFISADIGVNADFCLRAKGDSMINARINDGDIVFIKEQSMVENGEIGAVIIEDEATLKRVYYYPEKSKLILSPENPAYEPLVYIGEELNEIRILGKAVFFMSLL